MITQNGHLRSLADSKRAFAIVHLFLIEWRNQMKFSLINMVGWVDKVSKIVKTSVGCRVLNPPAFKFLRTYAVRVWTKFLLEGNLLRTECPDFYPGRTWGWPWACSQAALCHQGAGSSCWLASLPESHFPREFYGNTWLHVSEED